MKYIATYKNGGITERISFNGTDLFEVDKRAKKFGESVGYIYVSLDIA